MEEESTKMVWVVFVLAILALDVADCQDYSWDGVAAAGVPRTFYRFGPGIDNLMYPEDDGTTGVFVLPTAFPFFGTDQYYLSVSKSFYDLHCPLCHVKQIHIMREFAPDFMWKNTSYMRSVSNHP